MGRSLWVACWFWLLLGWAQAAPEYHQKFQVDLNHDGTPEVVGLRVYLVEGVRLGQLVVLNRQGQQLWAAPRVNSLDDPGPWSFLGEFDGGDIAFVDDFNRDGKVNLVATIQKSDVRPTCFKLFHWDGHGFVFERKAMLVSQPQKPATFDWTNYDPAVGAWVESIRSLGSGHYEAQLMELPGAPETAKMRYHPGEGFILLP